VLGEHIRKIEERGGNVAAEHLLIGNPAEQIICLRERLGLGLVIIGEGKASFVKRTLMRSVGEEIAWHSPCDVLVMHGRHSTSATRELRRRGDTLHHAFRPST
jgi:nucleotide-binding universal stress UspA family protein